MDGSIRAVHPAVLDVIVIGVVDIVTFNIALHCALSDIIVEGVHHVEGEVVTDEEIVIYCVVGGP